ncbi:hypothetical protein ACLOJK_019133 [Asimina triloba]
MEAARWGDETGSSDLGLCSPRTDAGKKCLEDDEAPDSLKVLADGELLVKAASCQDGEDAQPVHARLLAGCEEDERHGDER